MHIHFIYAVTDKLPEDFAAIWQNLYPGDVIRDVTLRQIDTCKTKQLYAQVFQLTHAGGIHEAHEKKGKVLDLLTIVRYIQTGVAREIELKLEEKKCFLCRR